MTSSILNHQLPAAPAPRGLVPVECEVTPGVVRTVNLPAEMLERFVAVKFVPAGKPGVMRADVRQYNPLVPVTDDLGERMGWGLERRQILALGIAGFIKCFRPTTGTTLVDPVSVWEFIHTLCLEDAATFWTPEAVRAYSDAAEFVRASGIVTADRRRKADQCPHLEFDFIAEPGSHE